MLTAELDFDYPEHLVATRPQGNVRVLFQAAQEPAVELNLEQLLQRIPRGDLLVINDTKVLKRRVFSEDLEVLFLDHLRTCEEGQDWQVLMPVKRLKGAKTFSLPGGLQARLVAGGRPQTIRVLGQLSDEYFHVHGAWPLPPYIQKARGQRQPRREDDSWYQTGWAQHAGSLAAPTASLHFNLQHLQSLQDRGVEVLRTTLHVGLGTFLPIVSEQLADHPMHAERALVSAQVAQRLVQARAQGAKVWALGTTVVRTLESLALGRLAATAEGYEGETDLFIRPGYQFRSVDRLLTNFHQPKTTLLALVAAFAGQDAVRSAYQWAIDNEFRLFSYGDLTVWTRP